MAAVGEAFLSAFIEVVLDRLASPELVNMIRGKKIDDNLVQRLKNTLYAVEAVLNDAEQRQIKDSAVNKWLDDLKDAVYVADDLLDHISTKAATRKNKEVQVSTATNFFSRYFNFQDSEREMVRTLEDVVGRLESILKRKDILGLEKIERGNSSWRTPSTSLDDGSNIYGRDEDKKAILKLLLDDDKGDADGNKTSVTVIPIVGMGGVGKTTLAQSVYNDDNIKQKFDFQAWACVSDDFDVLKVTKTITEAVTRSACNVNNINLLHLDLKERVTGKKFLIVLDDVWTEDYDGWKFLIRPLQYGAKGSKILVTTRSEKVAFVVQTFRGYHHLEQLSDEDCWSVFANHACLSFESRENMDLQKIGRKIVGKCKGLPLAAQSLGGLLRGKRDIRDWDNVFNNNIWDISENESKIIPALRISYHYLPPHLKRCFVYCSLYPKDYQFDKDELILLWMAEDLLQPSKNGKTLEEVGYGYCNDLASRSFFQRSTSWSGNRNQFFVMHDLVHDLATLLGGEFYFRTDELGKETKIGIKTRHFSFSNFTGPVTEDFEIFSKAKCLRTFLPIKLSQPPFNNENAPCIILSNLKYLRVLSFRNFEDLDVLPDSIGELIHLRYLDLSYTNIKTLPESLCNLYNLQTLKLTFCRYLTMLPNDMQNLVNLHYLDLSSTDIKTLPESLCNLYNLQTLKLSYCRYLTMLPNDMQNLVNLRHLDIMGTRLEEMLREMSNLCHLQHLNSFVVGKHEKKGIKELGTLSNLHGSLSIAKLENVTSSFEALEARITDKKHIEQLRLSWSSDAKDDFTDSQSEMDILGKLQPAKNLGSLEISGYRGTRFPEWVGDPSYHNITDLYLSDCHNCCILPPLGQLRSLKYLSISGMNMLETIGSEFFKNGDSFSGTPFPSLESLRFYEMSCWEVWHHPLESDAAFPVLKSLWIWNCPKLRGDLPTHLPALETIEIRGCDQLGSSLPRAPAVRKIEIRESNKVALRELPLSLEELVIKGRQVTESVLEAIATTLPTSLQILKIEDCSSVTSFPGDCLPAASLKTLSIWNCKNLNFPKQNHQHESLESLSIYKSCDSLTTLPLDTLPNLRSLDIRKCENLECLSVSRILQNLRRIEIYDCPNFVSFTREGLSAPNLTSFVVTKCVNLKSLPCHVNTLLPKLEDVWIDDCPEIETFPEGGMPPSLRTLSVMNCEKLLRSPSLTSMDMLTHLYIHGPCDGVEYFPKEGFALLPPSLTSLNLYKFSSLHTMECTGLLHLTSLQQLSIVDCPKLENMAGESLPASLIKLQIYRCPLLGERCRMKHPHIWPKISHIRGIRVNYRWI